MEMKKRKAEDLVLTCEQVRRCDRIAIEQYGMNSLVLMENAGAAAARYILGLLDDPVASHVLVVAGVGNNAGDGFVVARHLSNSGVEVEVVLCGARERYQGDALANLRVIERMELPLHDPNPDDSSQVKEMLQSLGAKVDLIVDAMLGTGALGPPREPVRIAIETINRIKKAVVSLDIPSGLDCDTGEPQEPTVRADHTVTFAALKKGFQSSSAQAYLGSVRVALIGIDTRYLVE